MKTIKSFILIILIGSCFACQKEFLEAKTDKSLLVPTKLPDFQALLNNQAIMNTAPYIPAVAADDYYTTDAGYAGGNVHVRNSYIWASDVWAGQVVTDWNVPYQQIFYANVVLDGLKELDPGTALSGYNAVKGSAYFFRAMGIFYLSQQFAAPYSAATAKLEYGLPVSLTSDVNNRPGRGNLQQTYDQMVSDLKAALDLVPEQVPFKNMPDKQTVYAVLARVYLIMENYEQALFYADACLKLPHKLVDYNTVNATPARPFVPASFNGNEEVMFHSVQITNSYVTTTNTLTIVDSILYRSYATTDLRKTLFFADKGKGVINFRGSYSIGSFVGVAIDEIYLIRAESYARAGNTTEALADLNTLLANRIKKGSFTPLKAVNANEALKLVLQERRKELISRGTRWSDLRRLNKDTQFAVTLKRVINGTIYELPPNDKRYVFPIPDNEISTSGIEQNPR